MRDRTKLIVGIVFLLGALYSLVNILTKDLQSYYVTGMILFFVLGLAFIRNSRY